MAARKKGFLPRRPAAPSLGADLAGQSEHRAPSTHARELLASSPVCCLLSKLRLGDHFRVGRSTRTWKQTVTFCSC